MVLLFYTIVEVYTILGTVSKERFGFEDFQFGGVFEVGFNEVQHLNDSCYLPDSVRESAAMVSTWVETMS